MFDDRKLIACSSLFAKVIFAGSVLLCSAGNAFADARLETSSWFVSADATRTNTYMDAAGTWNGNNEVTNSTGDYFFLTIDNQATGSDIDDSAFDLAINIDVASGFRLPASSFVVTVNELPVFPSCPVIAGVTATQPGGAGTGITLNFPAYNDIRPGCSYSFILGLTTDDVPPSVADGFYDVDFDVTYNVVDNDSNTAQTQTQIENVEVRTGEVALLKTAVTPIASDGDLVEFTVSILNAGDGGVFDVVLTDTLLPDLTNLRIVPLGSPPTAPTLGNPLTIPYIEESAFAEFTVYADVAVNPAAATCPDLTNTADVVDRVLNTSSFFDSVPFDLQNPFIDYTPPNINVPFGGAGIDVTIPVTNTGTGVAKNISISAPNLSNYTIVVRPTTPNWTYAGGGVFNFNSTISAAATANIDINVSATSCPPPANEDLVWTPAYQNACGTDFFPPIRFSTIAVSNAPDVNVTKTGSSGALNIGQTGTYTIALTGTNAANLPDDGNADNLDFMVTDTLPIGITNAVINSAPPATTEILVNGVAYVTGAIIPDGATITWRGDPQDLSSNPSLVVDYIAGANGVCPVGQTITNTATLEYAACGINNADSTSFILSESPAGGATNNIVVGGDGNFETGAADTNGDSRDEAREGEQIPFTVSYSFPTGFSGVWSGTVFNADLRSSSGTGEPLVLTNNRSDVHLLVSRISDGALVCNKDLIPTTEFTGGDGTGPLVISFSSIATGCVLPIPVNLEDHTIIINYSATSPEGDLAPVTFDPLNDDNVGGYLERTTLTVAAGPFSCLGPGNTDFIQAVNVNIERADLDLTATFNNGNPISVCEVVPASLNITGPVADTSSDNILLQFNDANFEFVDAAGNPGDPVNPTADLNYQGSMVALAMDGLRVGNDIRMTPAFNTTTVTADGAVNFNVRLRDSALPQTMAAQLDYDSNHTSPNGSDGDQDYSVAINASPFAVLSGDLKMEFFPPDIILLDSTTYNFRVQVENVGTGTAVNAVYRMTLPAGMRFDSAITDPATIPAPTITLIGATNFDGQTIEWDLGDLVAGGVVNIDINTTIDRSTCFQGPGEDIVSQNEWGCGSPIINTETKPPLILAPTQLSLTHDAQNSFCELCNEGEIHLRVSNTGGVLLTDVTVTEDLMASGLTYVPNSSSYFVDGVPGVAPLGEPAVSAAPGELITWTKNEIPELANLYSAFNTDANTPQEIEIVFRVQRAPGFTEEGLITANRNIEARAGYGLFCGPPPQTATSGLFELPIEQPVTDIIKQARNIDANQPVTAYADTVYGGTSDDVIWRVNVTNNGPDSRADLEDLLVNDTIGGNFDISQICNNEFNATNAANGTVPDGVNCISNPGVSPRIVATRDIADPFGNPDNDQPTTFIDALEGGQSYIYFVGTIQNTCTNHTNTADIEYGCQADSPPQGGITEPATNGGIRPVYDVDDDGFLSTAVDPAGMLISQSVTGSNAAQDLGSKGILTITIRNQSGGTVKNISFDDQLPTGYALDKSLMNATVTPAFGAYSGMIDTIILTNDNVANPENNISPNFSLTSSGPAVAPQNNLLRHDDVLTITLGLIRVSPFDLVADPVVRTENDLDGSDPIYVSPRNNALTVIFENTCGTPLAPTPAINNLSVTVNPEDLDIDIINPMSSDLIYVISDPEPLDLTVVLTNNGGHDAKDYFALVTVGNGLMLSSGVPSGCNPVAQPREVWPPAIPASSTMYQCSLNDPMPPGQVDNFTFSVLANVGGTDLTFRADVVGEITQANGDALTFPTPDTGVVNNAANNYSIDSIRARLIGFGLSKVLEGDCSENNLAATDVQIGEDCTYRMQASWFGFATPGFDSIQVQNVNLTDVVPAGQGFISQDSSASSVNNVLSTPAAPAALATGNIVWTFDPIDTDETFSIALETRSLNDPLNSSAIPNMQAAVRTDTLDASFEVSFEVTPGNFIVDSFDATTPGFPRLVDRQASIRITEPNLIVTKQVCNETLYGAGPTCSNFQNLVNDGNTNHDYIYRIRIENEAASVSPVAPRAPAFNVEVIDSLPSLLTVNTLLGIDNNNDAVIDSPLAATVVGSPETVTISHTANAELVRVDPGQIVTLYYSVDVDNSVAPGQMLDNSAITSYDSLAGASGNQNLPHVTGTVGGARIYTDTAKVASIVITNLIAPPDSKGVVALSHTTLGAIVAPATSFVGPQDVVIGEEIEFQLQVEMPVANLDNFTIRDELPAGLRCIEAQAINLSNAPYSAAGFVPGGPALTTTCTSTGTGDIVQWTFGNQQLTAGPTFIFTANFIARVDNTTNTNDVLPINAGNPLTLINGGGGGGTNATLSYTDASGTVVNVPLGPAILNITEPFIVLDKTFTVTEADARDVLTVTVTARNDGEAPAYNLRIRDDLAALANLTYLGNTGGADPPDGVVVGANQPIFSWNTPVAAGGSKSFTFEVTVGDTVQPLELLDNTITADWTSLPDNTVTLNAGGTIGADGDPDGMRVGDMLNPGGDLTNDFDATFFDDETRVPAVEIFKTDESPGVIPTIGARKNFQVVLIIPEGNTNDLTVTDDLIFDGNSFVLENNPGFDITYNFVDIVSINGGAVNELSFNAEPADNTINSAVWDIGDIITEKENDPTNNSFSPRIIINYFARIDNDASIVAGDNMQNEATLEYIDGETGATVVPPDTSSPPAITVLEPALTATKTFTNQTLGKPTGALPDGGDIIEYTVTITNSGGINASTAYDVNIVDTLPPELSLDAGFPPTVSIGIAPAFNVIPDNIPAGTLTWGQGQTVPNGSLDIPPGQDLILTYRVVLQAIVEPNLSIDNSVQIDWTSLDGIVAGERFGANCPVGNLQNNYCFGPVVATLDVIDANAVTKVITADTYVAPVGEVRVGDTLTFELRVAIQEGLTRQIELKDAMPPGMTFVDVLSVNTVPTALSYAPPSSGPGSNFSYAPIPAANLPVVGAPSPTTFTLGDITNIPDGDLLNDIFVIEYRARVTENAGIPHQASFPLDNTVILDYRDAANAQPSPAPTFTATTTVLQPLIDTPTKIDRNSKPDNVTVDPASDVMAFRLEACNVGGAPAYGVQITDDFPMQLDDTSLTVPVVTIGGNPAVNGVDYVYTAPVTRGGNMLFVFSTEVDPTECIVIDYDVAFYNDFAVNMTWSNSVVVDHYWSLPPANAQQYVAVGPTLFSMNNTAGIEPPTKVLQSPLSTEATIGEEVIYRITVPGAPMAGALHNVVITDTLDSSLVYLDVSKVGGSSVINDNTVLPGSVNIQTDLIPAGEQLILDIRARVDNNTDANRGDNFNNTAAYTFANLAGDPSLIVGGSSDPLGTSLTIVEPLLTATIVSSNLTNPGNPPVGRDVLSYVATITASGGIGINDFSDAFDISYQETLSIGQVYSPLSSIVTGGGFIGDPVITGDGITVPQVLTWSLANGRADIDILEGGSVDISYQTVVLDSILNSQPLFDAVFIEWTSLDGNNTGQRDGSLLPPVNDYVIGPINQAGINGSVDGNSIVKTRLTDTFNPVDINNRIGDVVDYELRLTVSPGTSPASIVTDILPQGLMFEQVVSINGDAAAPYAAVPPFQHPDIPAANITVAGDPTTIAGTTVTWNLGDIVNVGDGIAANDVFIIVYRARVLNQVQSQVNLINLENTGNYNYTTFLGPAPTKTDLEAIDVLQPNLAITKTAVAAGGDAIIDADEIITYTIEIFNSGSAPAYDVVLNDVIPVGLRNGALTITVDSMTLLSGTPLPPLLLAPVYDAVSGIAVWNFDTGVADDYSIPALDTLRIVYRVQADPGLGAGLTLINAANVSLYYSFDNNEVPAGAAVGDREVYGPTNTATVTLTTTNPNPPLQISPALTATIGQPFTYRIRIPDTAMATALHDVRILEDLSISTTPDTVDLNFVSAARVSGSQPWDVSNVGNLVAVELQDLAAGSGIEVPPLETIEVDMTVVLRDQPANIAGDVFDNTVSYTFNGVDGDAATFAVGGSSTSAPITVLEPLDMVVTMGPVVQPATNPMTFGTATTFTIDVENSTATNANASDAFDLTITNVLPDQVDVGMCDIPPANFTAEIRDAAGTVVRSLIENTDYVTSFTGVPACTLTITMQSVAARIEPNNHLFVTYDALLDVDGVDATEANNIAAATQWFSADTPAGVAVDEIREYNGLLSNGTPGTADEQDVVTVEVLGPVLVIEKEVFNVTSRAVAVPNVVLQAEAGDRLRYTITVSNTGRAAINDFSVTDEPDRLTSPPGLLLPGSMSNIILPVGLPNGVVTDFSNINAGANAAGILDIRTLSLDAGGGGVDSLVISFEMVIQPVVENGLLIMNQAELISPNFTNIPSDDPNFPGVIDPTQTIIGSAPVFVTRKTSVDLTGNTSVLAAGDTLRYTLRAQNVGAENSINTVLRDQIPANTSYVANSTTLNGVAVPDPGAAVSPLESGLTINAPENTTAGFMRADSVGTSNIATITFDVVVATNVINGTAISNQSFVQGTGLGGVAYPDQPSDDPDTDLINDPTVDVVGNLPILRIQKTATFALGGDLNGDDVVDNGERLRYTFNISNTGSIAATNVLLTDAVPANSNYNANSVIVNTVSLPDTLPGTSPLIAGINVSSTPSPAFPQVGVIEPGQSASVTFEVTVSGAPAQLITNQATLDSNELPQKLSDADGNDGNGDQQTVVVIGNAQQLSISKEVSVVGGGVATAGGQLEYSITARNIGSQPVTDIIISDTLAAQLTLVSGSATMNGSAVGITVSGANITADYATSYGDLESGEFITLRFLATIDSAQVLATTISNTARVDWNAGTQNATDSSILDVGAAPGVASVNGVLWWDANFNDVLDTGEIILPNWNIDIYLQGQLLDTVVSDQNGVFQANGLVASAASGAEYELRYRAPGAGATTASLGVASSVFTNAQQRISDIVVAAGSFNEAFNLPIDPNGIVYDSVLRTPVAGATLTMINQTRSNQPVPASCFDDPNHANQSTLAQGFYKFDLNFSNSLCVPGDEYEIQIQPPADGYVGTTSVIIPPLQAVTGNAQDVPNCSNTAADQVPATTQHCENSAIFNQPPTAVTPRSAGTNYYLKFLFNNDPVTDQIFNNHIPVDPELDAAIAISKVAGLLNVTRSQLVPYTITLSNSIGAPLQDLNVIDDFPAGFKYVAGSSRIDGVAVEPTVNGLQMVWQDLSVNTNDSVVIKMLLLVGSGVGEGEYVNSVRVVNSLTGEAASGVATATVRVIPDPTFDCTDIIGKVYEDSNLNTYQDKGEKGIPGVQVATARGLRVTTDTHGRFHITCAIVANEVNGSNFIMKVDDRSLPSGYRITTENPRVQRATRGKMMKFNFGASIHRVVRLDLADGVFEKGITALRPQWQSRIDMLITELQKDASILRLSYLGENESESEVDDRLDAIENLISDRWQELDCCYKLTIEKEVFWRKGNPSERKGFE